METHKQQLLEKLRRHIQMMQNIILKTLEPIKVQANRSLKEIGKLRPEEMTVAMQLRANAIIRTEELEHLYKAPYFTKCEVLEKATGEKKTLFFAKHQMSEESIYSWVAPAASIRFEHPGPVSYTLPDGTKKDLELETKEQYMIVDGKVLFFAREDGDKPRELIYQEHFTKQKSEFALPEIVAQMEKAQDQVIRAHHKGPFIISGPAGSGKTTLALHRVAYLTQAPDTAHLYPAKSIIVFVQDNGTKEYFSKLLPELGIHEVTITTFSEWAFKILGLEGYSFTQRYGKTETEKETYEYEKLKAVRKGIVPKYGKNYFAVLEELYIPHLSSETRNLLALQKKEKCLDRFDLSVLLKSYLEKYEKFETKRAYNAVVNNVIRKKTATETLAYNLIIVDEFQNYLPEQLSLMKSSLAEDTKSIIYVGDIAQQVYLGTIKGWQDIGESVDDARNVRLDKVYRNTKHILAFIQNLGYNITIPKGIKDGPGVTEKICSSIEEEIAHIKEVSKPYTKGSIGILAKDAMYLDSFKTAFSNSPHIHVMTMNESQGVEFDLVCLVGIDQNIIKAPTDNSSPEHITERLRIQKDLLYVALTRAITELHVLGTHKLQDIKLK